MDFVYKKLLELLWKAAQAGVMALAKGPLEQLKLRNKLSDSALATLTDVQPYLDSEGISPEKQEFLLDQCLVELEPLLATPDEFLRGSLNGETLYQRRYGESGPPQAIHEEQLDIPFRRVFPRIADRFNAYLPLTDKGKSLGMIETLRRFDEINAKFTEIAAQIREYTERDVEHGDENFHILHGIIVEALLGRLGVTGLLGKYRYEITLDDIFVLPALTMKDDKHEVTLNTPQENEETLFKPGARAFVEGPPGAGKTTWTCWLQSRALKRNPRLLAVRLRFRDHPQGDLPSYYDLIRSIADPNLKARIKDAQVDEWIKEGRLLFLLDGFDEVAPGHRAAVRKWIDGLHQTAPKAPILLTSRPLSTEHLEKLPKLWGRWRMQPFDRERVADYISRWYQYHPHLDAAQREVDASALAAQWQDDPSLKELTGNPLMLGTLLAVHQHEGRSLPRGRTKLYERYLEGMLGPWEQNIPVRRDLALSEDQKLGLLKGIAYYMLLHAVDALGEEDEDGHKGMHNVVADLIGPLHIKPPKGLSEALAPLVLSELWERTGMLDGPGTYSFVHKSIGEFLFAEILNDGHLKTPDGESLNSLWLFKRRHEDRWRGVLYFWAGLAAIKDLQSFIELQDEKPDLRDALLEVALHYDQLDRLPKAWLRQRILRLKEVPIPSELKTFHEMGWGDPDVGFGHCWLLWRADAPLLSPREFSDILREVIETCGVNPEEFADAPAAWQSQMWFVELLQANNSGNELALRSTKLKPLSQKGYIDDHILLRLINGAISPESFHVQRIRQVEQLLEAAPALKEKAVIIWCCAITNNSDYLPDRPKNAGRLVPLLKGLTVAPRLLVATLLCPQMFTEQKPYDLLGTAHRALDREQPNETVDERGERQAALDFINELILKRDALVLEREEQGGNGEAMVVKPAEPEGAPV